MILETVTFIGQAFSITLPILISGIFFIVSMKKGWLKSLDKPIDFGFKLGKNHLFGVNKNWRGALCYIFGGTLVTLVLHYAEPSQPWIAQVFSNDPLVLGFSICSAYVLGELVNSFMKRRLGIAPGSQGNLFQRFIDTTDGGIASGLVFLVWFKVPIAVLLITMVLSLVIHATTDVWMRTLGLKSK